MRRKNLLPKNTILAILMSACLGTAMGNVYTAPIAAASKNTSLTAITKSQRDVSLLVNQVSGSNKVELALQIGDSYNNSITSVEMRMQIGDRKIKKVTMDWDKDLAKSSCRATYNKDTGVLRVYVVGTSDLIENRMINIGTLKYESSEKDTFSTTLALEKVSTVDLKHNSDTLAVTESEHQIEFTYNDITPPSTTPSTKPENPSPSSNPSGSDKEDDKTESDSTGNGSNESSSNASSSNGSTSSGNTSQGGSTSTPSGNGGNSGSGSNGTNKEESSLSDSSESEYETESKEDTAVNEEETLEGSESSGIEDTTNREESEVVSDDISAEVTIDGTEESEGSSMFAIIAAIVASVIALGGVGFVVWKRKQGTENEEE